MKTEKSSAAAAMKKVTKPRKSARSYDAEATKRAILEAAIRLLTEQGFPAIGVNALATAAGVDKQLIYYHFGGLEGVVRAMGSELSLWLGKSLEPVAGERYAEATQRLMLQYASALRGNTLVVRLLAWELVQPSPVLAELESARSLAMMGWVKNFRAAAEPAPAEVDAPAINALLLAGLHYLALREKSVGSFAGMDIQSAEGIARIEKAISTITKKVYSPPTTTTLVKKGAAK